MCSKSLKHLVFVVIGALPFLWLSTLRGLAGVVPRQQPKEEQCNPFFWQFGTRVGKASIKITATLSRTLLRSICFLRRALEGLMT